MKSYNIVLWISLAMLALALMIWVQQRIAAARVRAKRARRAAERQELGGDSYFLPPAPIEQAVELANPVEIESLLAGEPETVAAAARRQLEEPTDIAMTGGLRELSLSVGTPAPMPARARRTEPSMPPAPVRPVAAASQPSGTRAAPAAMPRPPAGPLAGLPAAVPTPADNQFRIPVRELVLAWFEARGYRATVAFADARPIELILHHRKDQERSYAFVVERAFVTSERASSLLAHARASGMPRLLIAAEAGTEEDLPKRVQRLGIRLFDEPGIRAQLGRIDIRVAAKIIAVARSRALARRAAAAHSQQLVRRGDPLPAAKL